MIRLREQRCSSAQLRFHYRQPQVLQSCRKWLSVSIVIIGRSFASFFKPSIPADRFLANSILFAVASLNLNSTLLVVYIFKSTHTIMTTSLSSTDHPSDQSSGQAPSFKRSWRSVTRSLAEMKSDSTYLATKTDTRRLRVICKCIVVEFVSNVTKGNVQMKSIPGLCHWRFG